MTPNYETLFCAGHTWTSDGTLVAAGGDMGVIGGKNSYPFMKEGRDAVRLFDRNSLSWNTLGGVKLSEYRWYPTQVRGAGVGGVCLCVCLRVLECVFARVLACWSVFECVGVAVQRGSRRGESAR